MRLVYKIIITLLLPLTLTLGVWGWLSYRTMEKKILADTDLILKDYSDGIITRYLSGAPLPERFNGVYNTYYIQEVTEEYAAEHPGIEYKDAEAFLQRQEDFASSRVRSQIFVDSGGKYHEIVVSLPTFEQDVLVTHVLWWTVLLFVCLAVAVVIIGAMVISYNMRPLYSLLKWMEAYEPGKPSAPVPDETDIAEFKYLAFTAQKTVDRFERQYAESKLFIGNVSHELQTPLAVCGNRIELMLENPDMTEDMAMELMKLHRSIQGLARLNRTLLLLTKIENNQFPETTPVDLGVLIRDSLELNKEIYQHKELSVSCDISASMTVEMNDNMSSVLVNNLVKNAFVHSPAGGAVEVTVTSDAFSISNTGIAALDRNLLFARFYQPEGRKEGSTGLGLALVSSVCSHSGLDISYDFKEGKHIFYVKKS